MPGRGGIEALLLLMDEAFSGRGIEASNESQALLPNLASVTDDHLRARPPGVERTIEAIAIHVGACKVMYDDYAFGPGELQFGTPAVEPWGADGPAPREALVDWLGAVHARLTDHVAALEDDAELDRPRRTNWGEQRPTRWIVAAMITHDAYHAGEINHLRSLLDGDDRWRYVQLGFGS
jgi:DinB superfamily